MVRIYGYYPMINRNKITFYRYSIHKFNFIKLDSKEKWTAYKFTKNIYNKWILTYLKESIQLSITCHLIWILRSYSNLIQGNLDFYRG